MRSLSELFCTADRCPVIVGNTLVYRDDNHVTTEYAQVLAPLLAERVDGALSEAARASFISKTASSLASYCQRTLRRGLRLASIAATEQHHVRQ